jgi:hypothetical protein
VQLIAPAWQSGGSVAREVMATGGCGLQGSTGGSTSRASEHLGASRPLRESKAASPWSRATGALWWSTGSSTFWVRMSRLAPPGESDLVQSTRPTGARPGRHDAPRPAVCDARSQRPPRDRADRGRRQPCRGARGRSGQGRAELHPLDAACIRGEHVMLVSGRPRGAGAGPEPPPDSGG